MREVTHREVIALTRAGAEVIDTLPPHEYRAGHIRGALALPLPRLWYDASAMLSPARPVVAYCRDSL